MYPLIDPASHFASKTYKDKVIIVTGRSVAIGATAALFYAKAGAKVLVVVRRSEQLARDIEKEVPGAEVLEIAGDITDPDLSKRAVTTAVEAWGRLDIVLANQSINITPVGSKFVDSTAVWGERI